MVFVDWSADVCLSESFFFFKQKTAYEMRISDWSSDVCSSDLPAIFGDERRAARDHDAAQHDHRDNAPEQRAILVARRDREGREDQRDDEDIVDRQRLLDEEAGVILQARLAALRGPHPRAERGRDADIERRELQTLADPHLLDRKSTRLNSSH